MGRCRSIPIWFAVVALLGSWAQAQNLGAFVSPWGGPIGYAECYPPGPWTNCIVDTGDIPIGRCRAQALTNGLAGVDVFMKTDANRGMDVYSTANAGFGDRLWFNLTDEGYYAQADATVIRVRLSGSLQVAPPIGWGEIRVGISYPRGFQTDAEYGWLALGASGSQATFQAPNDTAMFPSKTNLFRHPLNQSLYRVGQAVPVNTPQAFDQLFYAVLPNIKPNVLNGGQVSLSLSSSVTGSGGTVSFYNTLRISRSNPVSFYVTATGTEIALQPQDQFRSDTGFLVPTAWSYPAPANPTLTVTRSGSGLVLSWPSGLELDFKPYRSSRLGTDTAWTSVGLTPTDDGTTVNLSLTPSATSEFFRLQSAQ